MYRVTIEEVTVEDRKAWQGGKHEKEKAVYAQLVEKLNVADVVSFINKSSAE